MNIDEKVVQHSVLLNLLEKNEDVQQAAIRLKDNADFQTIQRFIGLLEMEYAKESLYEKDINTIARYSHIVTGMKALVTLDDFVGLLEAKKKQENSDKLLQEQEDERRKYNPGNIARRAIHKVSKIFTINNPDGE